MAQLCPAKSTIVPFKKQMYSSGSIILSYKDDKCICVSIHAPTRGATTCSQPVLLRWSRFNPRTHEGCDSRVDEYYLRFPVSIHAPTRGATLYFCKAIAERSVSIHAPTRGATFLSILGCLLFHVSIHAPTRGATDGRPIVFAFKPSFNPRTHEGCDRTIFIC